MTLIANWTKERLKIEPYLEGKRSGWKVTGTLPGGGRVRKRFPDKAEAEQYRNKVILRGYDIIEAGDKRFTQLSRKQERDAMSAIDALNNKFGEGEWSLIRAAQFCLDNFLPQGWEDRSVEDATEEFLKSLRQLRRSARHVRAYEMKCGRLCKFFPGKLVAAFTPDEMREYIFSSSPNEYGPWNKPQSKTTHTKERIFLKSFFKFCKSRKWLSENPIDESVPSAGFNRHRPEAFSPEQARRILDAALTLEPEVTVPYFALGIFAAIRPDEARKLRWEDFIWRCEDDEPSTVIIEAATAKTSRRRSVELPENCVAWIKPYAKESGPISPYPPEIDASRDILGADGWTPIFDTVRARAGFKISPKWIKGVDPELAKVSYKEGREKWIADGLRHTGTTYRLEVVGDIGKVALWSGNSIKVINDHYRDIVRGGRKQVEEFYAILPAAA